MNKPWAQNHNSTSQQRSLQSCVVWWTSTVSLKSPLWLEGLHYSTQNNPLWVGCAFPRRTMDSGQYPHSSWGHGRARGQREDVPSGTPSAPSPLPQSTEQCLQQLPEHSGIRVTWKGRQITGLSPQASHGNDTSISSSAYSSAALAFNLKANIWLRATLLMGESQNKSAVHPVLQHPLAC